MKRLSVYYIFNVIVVKIPMSPIFFLFQQNIVKSYIHIKKKLTKKKHITRNEAKRGLSLKMWVNLTPGFGCIFFSALFFMHRYVSVVRSNSTWTLFLLWKWSHGKISQQYAYEGGFTRRDMLPCGEISPLRKLLLQTIGVSGCKI